MSLHSQTQAIEDERMLLSVALQDPERALDVIALVPAEDMTSLGHRRLMELLVERVRLGKSLVWHEILPDLREHADRFDLTQIIQLSDYAPSTLVSLDGPARRIRQRAAQRTLGQIGQALISVAQGEQATYAGDALPDDPDAVASTLAAELARVAEPAVRSDWTVGAALDASLTERREARERGRPTTVPTGSRHVDDLLDGGLRAGELVIVAGRPGAGKTAYALGLAADAASKGARVGIVSLEMGAGELADRVLSRSSCVPLAKIRTGVMDSMLGEWREAVSGLDLRIATPTVATVASIATQARRWLARGLDLLVIDYLQLVKHDRADRHDLAVGNTATACKRLARELRIPVVLLSQLNREVERRHGKAPPDEPRWWEHVELPRLSDLRDSGQIEQDADLVLFPVRAEQYGVQVPHSAALCVAKQRNGRTGVVPLSWRSLTAAYTEAP